MQSSTSVLRQSIAVLQYIAVSILQSFTWEKCASVERKEGQQGFTTEVPTGPRFSCPLCHLQLEIRFRSQTKQSGEVRGRAVYLVTD